MREEENGRGEKDRKSVPPETEKGTGAERREGKKLDAGMKYQAWNAGSIPARNHRKNHWNSGRTDYEDSAPASRITATFCI